MSGLRYACPVCDKGYVYLGKAIRLHIELKHPEFAGDLPQNPTEWWI